jgi:sulfite oxidase
MVLRWLVASLACASGGYSAARVFSNNTVHCAGGPSKNRDSTGAVIDGLPSYTTDDVLAHATKSKRIWVTYKAGVYDVTDFIAMHPGGEKRIMLAAGSKVDPYWKIFTIHDDDAVRDMLEKYRIGNFADAAGLYTKEALAAEKAAEEALWGAEPKRSSALKPLSARPFNAETAEAVLDEFYTPNELFYVRNHMPVPSISLDKKEEDPFCLQVEGEGLVPRCFPVDELKSMFEQHTIAATIQCGGNRRSEMAAATAACIPGGSAPAVKGLAWTNGGIGTATWTGVWLRDVIAACRVALPPDPKAFHVLLEGRDKDPAGHFNVSVPYELATNPQNDCLIAFKMNGEELPRDHGYPLRAVIPGTVGVRNCKWLQRIHIQSSEADSVWQQQDYKNFPPWAVKPDPSLPSVYAMPVQSAITEAVYDANQDTVRVKGYAYVGGGTGIQRVDVSYDGGKTFEHPAMLLPTPVLGAAHVEDSAKPTTNRRNWAWRQFSSELEVGSIRAKKAVVGPSVPTPSSATAAKGALKPAAAATPSSPPTDSFRVCVRAVANDNATQPAVAAYNFRGMLYNGYSCRDVPLS